MAEYLSVAEARARPGLRLAITLGAPGPWGEAAKGVFHVKRIPFARVGQRAGEPNAELHAWTGHRNAPVAVYADEPARTGWAEIALLAERLAPEPALIPKDPAERALAFGLGHELCGEQGLGWSRRLMMFQRAAKGGRALGGMALRYGYSPAAAAAAPRRVVEILGLLAGRLREQRARGSRFLVGGALSAVDIQWAAFAAMLDPLPPELCPMPEGIRQSYSALDPEVRAAVDPQLLEHRDFVYGEYLELPVDL